MRNIFYYNTMIGELGIEENGLAITKVFLVDKDIEKGPSEKNETELLKEAIKQLNEYFDGKRKEFNLPLAPKGTEFQRKYGIL